MDQAGPIVFVGPGVMAEAMVSGLIRRAGAAPDQLSMCGPRPERLRELSERHGVRTNTDTRAEVAAAKTIVLSVKPQSLDDVLQELNGSIPRDALVLSIVAGARIESLIEGLSHPAVIRSMPNTPAQVGEGITVWAASPAASAEQKETARWILSACGRELFVENEDYLDMATAVSGTGPAYVFLFLEAMVDAGVHLGFPRRIAEELVVQTVQGSVEFYRSSPSHFARLRNQVTSPGGTSAAALYYLEKAGFRTAISRAIWAAYERSIQLGQGRKRGSIDGA
ncbi:MAG TPA: pyrroline-5-carboxylate reductase [Anaerolineales bacterium]|nr:pyrroline-5-carboxylate reductase [Anaerolineales bacterium]